jgi:hypothetical protein
LGRPRILTDEQRREKRRVKTAKWREENRERSREIVRDSMRRTAAARAIAEGREPGKPGPKPKFTPEEKRAKRKAKTERWNALNIKRVREEARNRERAKREGTFVSQALPRLTEAERKAAAVALSQKRRARLRNAGGTFTRADIAALYEQQQGKCAYCHQDLGDDISVDHWMPLILGGTNDPSNLKLMHVSCNAKKGHKHPSELALPQPSA